MGGGSDPCFELSRPSRLERRERQLHCGKSSACKLLRRFGGRQCGSISLLPAWSFRSSDGEAPRLSIKEPTRRDLASYLFRNRFAIRTKLGPPAHVRE